VIGIANGGKDYQSLRSIKNGDAHCGKPKSEESRIKLSDTRKK
jgi:hypothetical protein